MSNSKLASLRWKLREDRRTIEFGDGKWFRFPRRTPQEIIDRIADLPTDYLDLGNLAADQRLELDRAKNVNHILKGDLDDLQRRIEGASDEQVRERLFVILQQDLEQAINLLIRFAYALGIQRGGELYEVVQALANKYKMNFVPPANYDYAALIDPISHGRGTDLVKHVGDRSGGESSNPNQVYDVSFNEETGKLDFEPVDTPPIVQTREVNTYDATAEELDTPHDEQERNWLLEANPAKDPRPYNETHKMGEMGS